MSTAPHIHIVTHGSGGGRRLGELLDRRGFRVVLSRTAEEALCRISDDPPDLLIDEPCPSTANCTELCRRIKDDPRTARTSVILLSPRADAEDVRECLQAGADDVLVGSYDPETLANRVETLFSGNREPVRREPETELDEDGTPGTDGRREALHFERAACEREKMGAVARLAAGVAHDFNNKLMVIKGYTQILDMNIGAEDNMRQFVVEIDRAVDEAAKLTDQLTHLGGRTGPALGPVGVAELLEELRSLLSRSVVPNVRLTIAHSSDVGAVAAEETLLKQAIMNLCINSQDAMPDGGELIVEASRMRSAESDGVEGSDTADLVAIEVRDSGTGMSVDTLAHIFEPYYTTKERGTGLGLATVYATMHQLGGRIECRSAPGEGTTFRLFLTPVDGEGSDRAGA